MSMLDGRICIVTRAAGSLGRASATRFAAEGAKVMLVDRDRPSLDAALKSLPEGQATAMLADVTSAKDTQAYVDATVAQADTVSPYALTGSIFATDRAVIDRVGRDLRFTAGNFYVNDKPTGAVVGQQPFGGARGSGTNDKAGSVLNLYRWVSPRTIKETFEPPMEWRYPHMG